MNKKQKINRILFIFAIILLSMFFQKITNAETFQPVGIGTNNNRNNTKATIKFEGNVGPRNIWQYTIGGKKSATKNVYCANAGARFYGAKTYKGYDIYNESLKNTFTSAKDNYNKILWTLDNMYIDKKADGNKKDDNTRANMIENLKKITNNSVNAEIDSINSDGNRDEIFYEISQAILWRYTKNEAKAEKALVFNYNGKTNNNALKVYNKLAEIGDKQGSYKTYNHDSNKLKKYISNLSFDNSQATINGRTAGPFVLKNYDEKYNLPSSWDVKVNGEKKKNKSDYNIRRENDKFYVDFNADLPDACTININLNIKSIVTTGTYWVQDAGGQDLISIDKSVASKNIPANLIKSAEYYLDVVKKDYETQKIVPGAKFSIKSEDGTKTYVEKENGADWGNLKTEKFKESKVFIITEESAPEGYINVLEGLKIKLTVSVNNGTLNFQRAIYRGDENVTDYYYNYVWIEHPKDKDGSIKLAISVSDPSDIDYNLKICKRSKTTNDYLSNAKFNVYTGDKTTLKGELVTDESGYSNTLSYSTDKLNTDLEPIYIKETQAPDGYKLDDSDEFIEIKSHIDSNGNIKLIDPINTDDIQMEVTTIDNIPTIVLVKYDNPDTVKYNIKIVKKDADTNKEITDKEFDIRGYITKDYPNFEDAERYSFKFTSGGNYIGQYEVLKTEQDLEPVWVSEISAPDGYKNNLVTTDENGKGRVFVRITPHIDKDGKLSVLESSPDSELLFLVDSEKNEVSGYKRDSKLYNYIEKPVVETIDGVQTIVLAIKDEPIVGNYNIQLEKINSRNETIKEKETKFTVNNEEKTTKDGILDIVTKKVISQDKQEDSYEIIETEAPEGYGKYNKKIVIKAIGKETESGFTLDEDASYIEIDGEEIKKGETSKDGFVSWDINDNTIKIKLMNKYFDLALRKWVKQAIVSENGKTVITETGHKAEDDPEEVVKVDLRKSKINDVTVKFNYSIRITNQGEIAGEATEIRDDIPQGLKFVAEDNPDWRVEDGQIVTDKLAGTTLQPGESAEVEILLTWVNSKDNMGVLINTAEINKDHNDYGAPDIDSTPGNNVPGEDDIDDAPVMLTVKTGNTMIINISLGLGIITILSIGIFEIKRKVLIDWE